MDSLYTFKCELFVTLATQQHLDQHYKALFETPSIVPETDFCKFNCILMAVVETHRQVTMNGETTKSTSDEGTKSNALS
jgi:hypothetical protein